MSQPKPADTELTKKGTPRKRSPGAGRPDAGRKTRLSLVTEECRDQFAALAAAWNCTIAEAIERAARQTHRRIIPENVKSTINRSDWIKPTSKEQ